jgi:hypothetical protein
MTEQIEALERLVRLREQGAISEAEFETEKAKVLASAEPARAEPLEPRRSKLPLFIGSGAVALIAAAALAYTQIGAHSGTAFYNATAVISESGQISNETMADADMAEEPTVTLTNEASVEPPATFLDLCVASERVPLGFRVRRLSEKLERGGRSILWKPSAGSWIMTERWHDDLGNRDHQVSFLFTAVAGVGTQRYCRQDVVEVQIERIVADGDEMTGQAMDRIFNAHAEDLYMKDIQPLDDINAEKRRKVREKEAGDTAGAPPLKRKPGDCDDLPADVECDYGGD